MRLACLRSLRQTWLPLLISGTLFYGTGSVAAADTFYVSTGGKDLEGRNGRSWDTAWKSLAYACEQVPEGKHTIRVGSGTFVATRTAHPQSGVTIVGNGRFGKKMTRIVASKNWKLVDEPRLTNPPNEYLIAFTKKQNIGIRNLALASDPEHRITGAIYCMRSSHVHVKEVGVFEFRWSGMHFQLSGNLNVERCVLKNASTDRSRFWNGAIKTRYIKNSEFQYNKITSTDRGGYGYAGAGHTKVRIHHNYIDVNSGFSIECPHENEYGVEIDHNYLTRCVSVPKGAQSPDPNKRGCQYTFWIHHNYMTDSYTIEGPRNHLRISHNYIHIDKPNGRVYTHHGGTNHGPVWIHQNVIENVDRALVWMNNGLAENIYVYNNMIVCADAGKRAGALLDSYKAERLNNWVFKNNIVVAAWSQPRKVLQEKRGVPKKVIVKNNLFLNMLGVPEGNFVGKEPGLFRKGPKPWEFYLPTSEKSFVVDKGIDVGLPFRGKAPDLGAIELGEKRKWGEWPLR
ncbi:MAG: right-handed parallel beta-helix repeat-containing protein [Gemmataceae bacterium]